MSSQASNPELSPQDPGPGRHDPLAALRHRDFRLLALGKLLAVIGEQAVSVAVGWELYRRTGSAFLLGMVGLVQIIPVFVFALPAGHVADRFDRKRLVYIAQTALGLASLGLVGLSLTEGPLALYFVCLFVIGLARAFKDPAASTLLPHTVPQAIYANAATWSSASWQLASVAGPALGGFGIAIFGRAAPVYAFDVAASAVYVALVAAMHARPRVERREPFSRESFAAGLRFVWTAKPILASITLDMFAVLLGGATALLPVFAQDILRVGPVGLGFLRAAPSVGAITAAGLIAWMPPFRKAGRTLLWSVAGFGAATVVFGLSESYLLSLAMLALLGGLDQVSVVIRSTLLLVQTPDELRGRVAAVHNIFVGASNELGAFESGVAAWLIGPVYAVAGGGLGTLVVVLLVAAAWPEVRRMGRLTSP
jgi:MFS family permease